MAANRKFKQLAYGSSAMKCKEKWPVYLNILSSKNVLVFCRNVWRTDLVVCDLTEQHFLQPGKAVPSRFKIVREIHQVIFRCIVALSMKMACIHS